MFGLGFGELVLVLLIALIFIGPKKLPELAKGLGQGLKEFQKAAKGFSDQLQNAGEEHPTVSKTEVLPETKSSPQDGEPFLAGGTGPVHTETSNLETTKKDESKS